MEETMDSVVGGFAFSDAGMARQAKKERQVQEYLSRQMDMGQPGEVLKVYRQIIERRMFVTQVGYCYLKEVQEYLRSQPSVPPEDILPIPIEGGLAGTPGGPVSGVSTQHSGQTGVDGGQKAGRNGWNYRKLCGFLGTACAVLLISVVGMFVIATTSSNPTILNYEEKLIDKYAAWETELVEREAEVTRREQALR